MEKKNSKINLILCMTCLSFLILLEFLLHRKIPFMMDDLWYGTNLVTGEKLKSLTDIFESQVWHYHHWGGRSITHGILQVTLMSGELCADILNLLMTLLLAWMICRTADEKNPFAFLGAFSMLVAFNANCLMSMFWQAGTVNYVYSTVWILLFVQGYLGLLTPPANQSKEPAKSSMSMLKSFFFGILWILLGFITGWSNENMGPASFVLSVFSILYHTKKYNGKPKISHVLGSLACLAGSTIMILAPGNFVRKEVVEQKSLLETIYDRLFSMLEAGVEFLFPVLALMLILLLFYCVKLGKKPGIRVWTLLGYAILSYGAMILSPHYPDRATFGTMTIGIVIISELIGKILQTKASAMRHLLLCQICIWIFAAYQLINELFLRTLSF